MSEITKDRGPYSATDALLLRATAVAEQQQDQSGIAAIATAFAALGRAELGSMTWSRLHDRWIERTDEAADWVAAGCFAN